jgi:hypothetical protein
MSDVQSGPTALTAMLDDGCSLRLSLVDYVGTFVSLPSTSGRCGRP